MRAELTGQKRAELTGQKRYLRELIPFFMNVIETSEDLGEGSTDHRCISPRRGQDVLCLLLRRDNMTSPGGGYITTRTKEISHAISNLSKNFSLNCRTGSKGEAYERERHQQDNVRRGGAPKIQRLHVGDLTELIELGKKVKEAMGENRALPTPAPQGESPPTTEGKAVTPVNFGRLISL